MNLTGQKFSSLYSIVCSICYKCQHVFLTWPTSKPTSAKINVVLTKSDFAQTSHGIVVWLTLIATYALP